MSYIIVGLGNPGEEYEKTRHNSGRIALEYFRKKNKFPKWEYNKRLNGLVSEGKIGKREVKLIEPETFMNKSGLSLKMLVSSRKKAEQLIIIHDDLDLPLATFKIVFNRGSGGHKGIESIVKNIRTKAFTRIRIGISPTTPSGKIKKPKGEQKVIDFILGTFRTAELKKIQIVARRVERALVTLVSEGKEKAMSEYN